MPPRSGYGEVRIEGLPELNRSLKALDPALQKELRRSLLTIGKLVAAGARTRAPVRSGRARASIRAGATSRGAYVQGGKAAVPYFGWLDFGGTLRPSGRRRNTQHRPAIPAGRFLYPAIKEREGDTRREALAAVQTALTRVNLQ